MNKLRMGYAAVGLASLALCVSARATPLTLVSGAIVPYQVGYVPLPADPPQSFTASQIAAMSDGNPATSVTASDVNGQYSSNPQSLTGFALRFDFDISQFSQLSTLNFSWTGTLSLTGTSTDSVWIGNFENGGALVQNVLTFNTSGGAAQTGTASYNSTSSDSHYQIADVVHGDLASVWVMSDIGFTEAGSPLNNLSIVTDDVSAEATRTLAPVPLPASLPLLLSGLVAAGLGYLAVRRREPSAAWA